MVETYNPKKCKSNPKHDFFKLESFLGFDHASCIEIYHVLVIMLGVLRIHCVHPIDMCLLSLFQVPVSLYIY